VVPFLLHELNRPIIYPFKHHKYRPPFIYYQQNKIVLNNMSSLQHLEASALVQLLTDSIARKHNTGELQSLHLALDVCLQSVKNIQEAMQECQSKSNHKEAKEAKPSLSLTSLNTDTLLEICSYADIKSKVMLRFTASSVHKAMMRCPLDFSNIDSDYILVVDTIPLLTNYFPIRYWKCLNTKVRSYCDQEALCPINMLDMNKSELHLRHFAHSGDDDVAAAYANHKSTNLSLSELNSLGFDRSWTITGAAIFEQDITGYKSLFSNMAKYDAHHSFKSICFHIDTSKFSVNNILLRTDESVVKGIEKIKICKGNEDLSLVDDFSVFERFSSLRSLEFHNTIIADEFLDLPSLTNLERFVTRECESEYVEQHLDFLKPLTKLKHLVLGVDNELGWKNASSISCLNQLTHFELLDHKIDLKLSHLSCLTQLEVLDASYVESLIEGNIESLSKLRKLKKLSLAGQHVHGNISALMDMTNLTCLGFSGCKVMGDISSLSKLTKLSRLSLSGPVSGDIEVISSFIKLESCFLDELSVHGDIAVFSHLTATTKLVIQRCSKIEGDISCLSRLTKLTELQLTYCPEIKGSLSSILGIIEHLRCFFSDGTGVDY
jgi:hypothetical protein